MNGNEALVRRAQNVGLREPLSSVTQCCSRKKNPWENSRPRNEAERFRYLEARERLKEPLTSKAERTHTSSPRHQNSVFLLAQSHQFLARLGVSVRQLTNCVFLM